MRFFGIKNVSFPYRSVMTGKVYGFSPETGQEILSQIRVVTGTRIGVFTVQNNVI